MGESIFNFVITMWFFCVTDSGEDELTNSPIPENCIHKFRLLDDAGNYYCEGLSAHNDCVLAFAPLDYYENIYGVTAIEYFNEEKGEWELL